MKRRTSRNSSIYAFLQAKGILEKGTHEEIQSARKEYWNDYKRRWRIEKRRKEKEVTLSLSRDELKLVTREAKRHNLSQTQFLKQASFAYINRSFIVPNSMEVKRIVQLLSMTYNSLQVMSEEEKLNSSMSREVLHAIHQLEIDILPLLHNPKSIEEHLKQHIEKRIGNKEQLLKFINSL